MALARTVRSGGRQPAAVRETRQQHRYRTWSKTTAVRDQAAGVSPPWFERQAGNSDTTMTREVSRVASAHTGTCL